MVPQDLRIGMNVRHPAYGNGRIVAITEQTADVLFHDDTRRTVSPESGALQPAEPMIAISGLEIPLDDAIARTVRNVVATLEIERPTSAIEPIAPRWHSGMLVLKPADTSLQSKEVPLEIFFHKIVMMRNQLRVLEQKINGNDALSEAQKVELQSYITRCYGSMTTFNVLFREKEDGF